MYSAGALAYLNECRTVANRRQNVCAPVRKWTIYLLKFDYNLTARTLRPEISCIE